MSGGPILPDRAGDLPIPEWLRAHTIQCNAELTPAVRAALRANDGRRLKVLEQVLAHVGIVDAIGSGVLDTVWRSYQINSYTIGDGDDKNQLTEKIGRAAGILFETLEGATASVDQLFDDLACFSALRLQPLTNPFAKRINALLWQLPAGERCRVLGLDETARDDPWRGREEERVAVRKEIEWTTA